jgi:DNA-binding response OmpR family regulator
MNKPYVAIVDDDSAFAAYLRTFLSLRGYEARCYSRGDELLASMKQAEAPDVVLLDVMDAGAGRVGDARALRSSRPEAQVIMLSGATSIDSRSRAAWRQTTSSNPTILRLARSP